MVKYVEEKHNQYFKIDIHGKKNSISYEKFRSIIKNQGNVNLFCHIEGGFGNKLFIIFNTLSQCIKDENRIFFFIEKNDNRYRNRKLISDYNIFNKLKKNVITQIPKNLELNLFRYTEYKYYDYHLFEHLSYRIGGYFQSYKYFVNYTEQIKGYLNINYDLIKDIKYNLQKLNKKTIAIHYRLDDYLYLEHYHGITPQHYYQKALSLFDLNNYKIILFSDQIDEARKRINIYCQEYIEADKYYQNEEQQFFLMSCCDVIIGTNSSFSLMSSYFNNIYNFNNDSKYIFPSKWFNYNAHEYNINDLIPIDNKRYTLIENYKCCVIFYHSKINNNYNFIKKCIQSVFEQENINFDILEINYDNQNKSYFKNYDLKGKKHYFFNRDFKTHTQAMIYLLHKAFKELHYDIVFNTNLDDYYDSNRFKLQYNDILYNNNFLNSSFFYNIDKNDNVISVNDSNIINNSGLCISNKFWSLIDSNLRTKKFKYTKSKNIFQELGLINYILNQKIPYNILNYHLVYNRNE